MVTNINNGIFWWDEPNDDMGLQELEQYKASLEELKKKVIMRVDDLMLLNNSSSTNLVSSNNNNGAMMNSALTTVVCDDMFLNIQNSGEYNCNSFFPNYGSDDFGNKQWKSVDPFI
ncbi:hypothetical protein ACH5RR_002128 [Cinchona calisaya]|uniref:PRONE domain-containing protein n=1 Tax=Cinchona calisaya TaxID=153742 RepID=A0ABD3B5C7_9GENT